jgi:hypothetical protein
VLLQNYNNYTFKKLKKKKKKVNDLYKQTLLLNLVVINFNKVNVKELIKLNGKYKLLEFEYITFSMFDQKTQKKMFEKTLRNLLSNYFNLRYPNTQKKKINYMNLKLKHNFKS